MTSRGKWQALVVLLTAIPRIGAVAWAAPVVMPDSERYRDAADPFAPFQVWEGHGPGVIAQLVDLAPLHAAVLIQTAIAATLWGAAALYAGHLASDRLSWPTFLTIHAWSLSPWFVIWDAWILTETLTMAGCALTAVGVAAARTGARHGHWVAVTGLAVAVGTRPFVGAMLLPLVALTFVWPLRLDRWRRLLAPAAASVVVATFAVWQVVALSSVTSLPFSYLPEPESLDHVQATDRLAGRGHLPGYLDLAREDAMPSCPEAESLAADPARSSHDILTRLRAIDDCPELDDWLAAGGLPWHRELTDNTAATVAELVRPDYWLRETFTGYMPSDDRIRTLRETAGARWPGVVLAVNAVMLAATALATLSALVLARGHRAFFAATLAVVLAVSVHAWAIDGIEYWRHLLPAFAVLLPSAVALLASARRTSPPRSPRGARAEGR